MRMRILSLFVANALVIVCASRIQAQCVVCGGDYQTCYGYGNSGNGLHCTVTCSCGLARVGYLDTLHPGLFMKDENGKRIVESVIPASPAAKAGLRPGDVILSINSGAQHSCGQGWAWSSASHSTVISVERGDKTRQYRVPLAPIRAYLVSAGLLSRNPSLKKAAFVNQEGLSAVFHSLGK